MFCTKCGAQLPDGSVFCSSCGATLNAAAAPAAQPVAPAQPAAAAQPAYAQPAPQAYAQPAPGLQYAVPKPRASFAAGAAVGGGAMQAAGAADGNVLKYVSIAASALGFILGLLLPIVSISSLGIGYDLSVLDYVNGFSAFGSTVKGEISSLAYIALFAIALVLALVLKGKAMSISQIVCGALEILLLIAFAAYMSDLATGIASASLAIGYFVMIIAAIALVVLGIMQVKQAR